MQLRGTMTLPEVGDKTLSTETEAPTTMAIGDALKDLILEAKEMNRLTCGIYGSAKLLEMDPEDVMLCILPEEPSEDFSIHIQHTLIDAFCLENGVGLVKVDSREKLATLLNNGVKNSRPGDYSCVLVQYFDPKNISQAVKSVTDFYKYMSLTGSIRPLIEIPI